MKTEYITNAKRTTTISLMELNLIICGSKNIIFECVIHGYRTRLKHQHICMANFDYFMRFAKNFVRNYMLEFNKHSSIHLHDNPYEIKIWIKRQKLKRSERFLLKLRQNLLWGLFLCWKYLLILISVYVLVSICSSIFWWNEKTGLESNVGWRWKMEGKERGQKGGGGEKNREYLQLMRRVCPRGNFHKPMNVSFRPDGDIQMVLININYNLL